MAGQDWNGDGKRDLIVSTGKAMVLLVNAGTNEEPVFGKPQQTDPNGEFIGAPRQQVEPAFGLASQLKASGLLKVLDAWKQAELEQALQLLEAAKDNSVMLLGAPVSIRLD